MNTRPFVSKSDSRPANIFRASSSPSTPLPFSCELPESLPASNSSFPVQMRLYVVDFGRAFFVARSISPLKCVEGETLSSAETVRRKRVERRRSSGSLVDGDGRLAVGGLATVERGLEKAASILVAKEEVAVAAAARLTAGLGLTAYEESQRETSARSWRGTSKMDVR